MNVEILDVEFRQYDDGDELEFHLRYKDLLKEFYVAVKADII